MAGADGFQTDVESLKSEGTNFTKLGEDFHNSLKRLMNGLHALDAGPPASDVKEPEPEKKSFGQQFVSGLTSFASKDGRPPWGDDDIGEKFGVVYEGVRDGMNESMGHLSAKLQEIGKALTEMSKNHAENEDFNEALMNQHVKNDEAWSDPTKNPKTQVTFTRAQH
ncbi:hypothetical protein AB0C96_30585 [Streptomyces sp. NPDC048506]|uniref:hypothetical protein n=1 Tax=Streptomyces sp. NPDC048506 TaxID=3155028 RepID=UPI00342E0FCE